MPPFGRPARCTISSAIAHRRERLRDRGNRQIRTSTRATDLDGIDRTRADEGRGTQEVVDTAARLGSRAGHPLRQPVELGQSQAVAGQLCDQLCIAHPVRARTHDVAQIEGHTGESRRGSRAELVAQGRLAHRPAAQHEITGAESHGAGA